MNNQTLVPVTPCNTPAPWIGGKRLLAKRLCALIDATDHTTYCEPFLGMGGIFLRRNAAIGGMGQMDECLERLAATLSAARAIHRAVR